VVRVVHDVDDQLEADAGDVPIDPDAHINQDAVAEQETPIEREEPVEDEPVDHGSADSDSAAEAQPAEIEPNMELDPLPPPHQDTHFPDELDLLLNDFAYGSAEREVCCEPECVSYCCGEDPCTAWTISAGGLFMHRVGPDAAVLFSNPDSAQEAMNASDFGFNYEAGYDVGLTWHSVLWGTDIEARFFLVDGWTATNTLSTSTDTQIHTSPPLTSLGPRDISSIYASELNSLEVNLRRRFCAIPQWTWRAGFRSLELDEDLRTVLADPMSSAATVRYDVNARNRLYGFQLGAELDLFDSCSFCARGFVKGGVYANSVNNNTAYFNNAVYPANGTENRTAFMGEVGLAAKYYLGYGLAVRADYRAMWLEGVALASNQVAATTFATFEPNGIDAGGTAFYHGVFIGLDWAF
jgi:hypothetical protein